MWYVYILKSQTKDWKSVDSTGDLKKRFREHNRGEVQAIKHYRSFVLEANVAVRDKERAVALEKHFKLVLHVQYLKRGFYNESQSVSFNQLRECLVEQAHIKLAAKLFLYISSKILNIQKN